MTYAAPQYTGVKTLQQAIQYFSSEQNCIDAVVAMRWPDGKPICPSCGHKDHYWLSTQKRWKCKECWKQFSVKVGTIFEDSPIPLSKWLLAMWMIGACKNGASSWEIHRAIGVTQKSAWFMMHRIRLSMHSGSMEVQLGGSGKTVEVDETFIGGKARNITNLLNCPITKLPTYPIAIGFHFPHRPSAPSLPE